MGEAYKLAFDQFDSNGDGTISTAELEKAMNFAGKKLTKCELEKIVAALDKDGNGKIDYKEFCAYAKPVIEENDLLFRRLDKDGSGCITADELKAAFTGCKISQNEIDGMIKAADKDGNGKIDVIEFRSMLL